jgi:hypothetical protein
MSDVLSSDMPVVFAGEPAETAAVSQSTPSEWGEMALTVMFTLAAVLFVSFLAVVTGLA